MVKEFALNINERYEHSTNPTLFAGLIVSRALVKTTVARLADFDVAVLQSAITRQLQESTGPFVGALSEGAQVAEQMGQQAAGKARQAVDEAAGTLKKLFGNS